MKTPGRNIMIIEDDLPLLRSLCFTLKRHRYLVGMSSNGRDALENIVDACRDGRPFDLLVTDMAIPGIDGLGLFDKLHKQGIAIPVLVIAAQTDKDLVAQLEKRGIKEILIKPFNSAELVTRVSSLLEHPEDKSI